jgi:hypothetical protein
MSPSSSCIVCSAPLSLPHLSSIHYWRWPQSKEPLVIQYTWISCMHTRNIAIQGLVLGLCCCCGIELARVSCTQTILTFRGYLIFLSYSSLMSCNFLYSNCIECCGYPRAPLARLPTNFILSRKSRTCVNFLHVLTQTRWASFRCRCGRTFNLKSKREGGGDHGEVVHAGSHATATRLPRVATCQAGPVGLSSSEHNGHSLASMAYQLLCISKPTSILRR